jgi:hypothetical protein
MGRCPRMEATTARPRRDSRHGAQAALRSENAVASIRDGPIKNAWAYRVIVVIPERQFVRSCERTESKNLHDSL